MTLDGFHEAQVVNHYTKVIKHITHVITEAPTDGCKNPSGRVVLAASEASLFFKKIGRHFNKSTKF